MDTNTKEIVEKIIDFVEWVVIIGVLILIFKD